MAAGEAVKLNDSVNSDDTARKWALKLFSRSPLKQEKLFQIKNFLEQSSDKTYLDIGSDNGVISFLLRKDGGSWFSADLIPSAVDSIRTLVGERVFQLDPPVTPFDDNQFDCVVIVDFLEHIESDNEFIQELSRIIKEDGDLIINIPNPRPGILRFIKNLIGQTDEAHGHLRPGYSLNDLKALLGDEFKIKEHNSYSRAFSVFIDMLITAGLSVLRRGTKTKKGSIVTGDDLGKLKKSFKLYSFIYPFVALFVKLDKIFWFLPGHMLIVKAIRRR